MVNSFITNEFFWTRSIVSVCDDLCISFLSLTLGGPFFRLELIYSIREESRCVTSILQIKFVLNQFGNRSF